MAVSASTVADRIRVALDLYEVGENMLRQRLRQRLLLRGRPEASAQDVDAAIAAWLQRRPGAEHGDYPGPPSSRQL